MIVILTLNLTNEGSAVVGDESPDFLDLEPDSQVTCEEPVHYDLTARRVSNGVLVTGRIDTRCEITCRRCLNPLERDVANDDVCHFFEHPVAPELDLTSLLREDIVIVLPDHALCSDDCAGLCPRCGRNLNEEKCDCRSEETTVGVWSELDKINQGDLTNGGSKTQNVEDEEKKP